MIMIGDRELASNYTLIIPQDEEAKIDIQKEISTSEC